MSSHGVDMNYEHLSETQRREQEAAAALMRCLASEIDHDNSSAGGSRRRVRSLIFPGTGPLHAGAEAVGQCDEGRPLLAAAADIMTAEKTNDDLHGADAGAGGRDLPGEYSQDAALEPGITADYLLPFMDCSDALTVVRHHQLTASSQPALAEGDVDGSAGDSRYYPQEAPSPWGGYSGRSTALSSVASRRSTAAVYRGDPWRFVVLLSYCLNNGLNSMLWITFAYIIEESKLYYGITAADVDTLTISYSLSFIFLFWTANLVFGLLRLKWGLFVCNLLNLGCVLARLLSVYATRGSGSYPLVLLGHLLGGFSQVLAFPAPPLVSVSWFPARERGLATCVGTSSSFIGSAIGMLLSPLIVSSDESTNATEPWNTTSAAETLTEGAASDLGHRFAKLFWLQFGLVAFTQILATIVPAAPATPPSPAAEKRDAAWERGLRNNNSCNKNNSDNASSNSSHKKNNGHDSKVDCLGADVSGARGDGRGELSSHRDEEDTGFAARLRALCGHGSQVARERFTSITRNRPFLVLMLIFGLNQGVLWTLLGLFPQFVQSLGVTTIQMGALGFSSEIVAATSTPLFGMVLMLCLNSSGSKAQSAVARHARPPSDKSGRINAGAGRATLYRRLLIALSSAASGVFALFSILLALNAFAFPDFLLPTEGSPSVSPALVITSIVWILLTALLSIIVPIFYEVSSEITFPELPEQTTTPTLILCPAGLSVLLTKFVGVVILGNNKSDSDDAGHDSELQWRVVVSMIFLSTLFFMSNAVLLCGFRPRFKRYLFELGVEQLSRNSSLLFHSGKSGAGSSGQGSEATSNDSEETERGMGAASP